MISRLHAFALVVVTCGVGVVVACSDKENACTVDTDCGQGSFCRDGLCASVGADASAPDGQIAPICVSPGGSCNVDDDCCTRPCTSFRCAGGTPGSSGKTSSGASGTSGTSGASGTSGTSSGTTSSGGSCTDLYGLCASDFECCPGLACLSGTCR